MTLALILHTSLKKCSCAISVVYQKQHSCFVSHRICILDVMSQSLSREEKSCTFMKKAVDNSNSGMTWTTIVF